MKVSLVHFFSIEYLLRAWQLWGLFPGTGFCRRGLSCKQGKVEDRLGEPCGVSGGAPALCPPRVGLSQISQDFSQGL